MKKGKLFMLCCAFLLSITTFAFAGCANPADGSSPGGGVESGGAYTPPNSSDYNGDEKQIPVESGPELKSMATYFSGLKAEYLKTNLIDETGASVQFNVLLNRQIDVLAQDLIYRLNYVYGNLRETPSNVGLDFTLQNNGKAYNYKGSNALVNVSQLLTSTESSVTEISSVNLSNIKHFQDSFNLAKDYNNALARIDWLCFIGAMDGKYLQTNNKAAYDFGFSDTAKSDSKWIGSAKYVLGSNAKDSLKMAIAEILSGKTITGSYSSNNYNNALSNIKHLGFSEENKTQISNFIFNNIIGSSLVATDVKYENIIKNEHSGVINGKFVNAVNNSNKYSDTYSPRFYKGYNIVIPAMVNQAVNNTFSGLGVKIYPYVNRMAVQTTFTPTGLTTSNIYSTIVLMPKTNAPLTKLVAYFTGSGNSLGATIPVTYEVSVNGQVKSATKNITLSSSGTMCEFDLHSLLSNSKFGEYNGANENDFNTNLYVNNSTITNINNGTNYIKYTFTNSNNYAFKVSFDGLYDKI